MKIAFTTRGHFDPSMYQCHMALATISLALWVLIGRFGLFVGELICWMCWMCVCTQASEHLDLSGRLLVDTESPLVQAGRTVSDTPPKDQEATAVCTINHGLHQSQISGVERQEWQSPFLNSLPPKSLSKRPSPDSECTCRNGTLHLRQNSGSTTAHRKIICPKSIY